MKGIQIRTQTENVWKPVPCFYVQNMSWNQWIPYQVLGKTKVLFLQFEHLVFDGNPKLGPQYKSLEIYSRLWLALHVQELIESVSSSRRDKGAIV